MLIVVAALVILVLYGVKFSGLGAFHSDYCSPRKTNALKGIFVLTVVLSHMRSYVTIPEEQMLAFVWVTFLGQLMVAPFLFYSGYGVMESIKKKGISYVRRIPVQRVAKTLLHFDLAVLLFLIVKYIVGGSVTLPQLLLSLVGWETLGNSNWYVFVVLALYIITYIAFLCGREHSYLSAIIVTALAAVFVVVLSMTRDSWWHDTLLCYVLGIWFSLLRKPLERILLHNDLTWSVGLLLAIAAFVVIWKRCDLYVFAPHLMALAFMVMLVLISAKISFDNPFLQFLGKYTFWIYILQRIPMILLSHFGILTERTGCFFLACFAITCLLAVILDGLTKQLDRLVFRTAS